MIRRLRYIVASIALGFLLSGCATSIRSNVIAFHEWPAEMPASARTFAFERTPQQNDSLEYRTYEDMVRNELSRLSYVPNTEGHGAALAVALSYEVRAAQVVVTEPYDPFWYGPGFYPGWGWRQRGMYPYYQPFFAMPMRQTVYPVYTHRLHVLITRNADKKPLYEVEVVNESSHANLPSVMPYMIRSAFIDFPGQSGVAHQVRLKVD